MSERRINERILQEIRKKSGSDELIAEFLSHMIWEEAEHSLKWWWKETYIKKVEQYTEKWEDTD